ncbi:hypothetical protein KDL29_07805 [bacterium]|nr:hypothetical protein [bacterium]
MSSKDNKGNKGTLQQDTKPNPGGLLPFMLIGAVILAIAIWQFMDFSSSEREQLAEVHQQVQQKQDLRKLHEEFVKDEAAKREQAKEANIALGLDPEYPSWLFPIYEGMQISETSREDATSSLGEAMDKWHVKGTVDAELKDIQQFYKDRLQEAGFRQTQYISIPNGYAFNYANEWYDTAFEIEKKEGDELPGVDITIYRVRDDSVKFSN